MGDFIPGDPVFLHDPSSLNATKPGEDATNFAWNNFGIDAHTAFLANPPLSRLPPEWEAWEAALDDAVQQKLQLGALRGLSEDEKQKSEEWRSRVRDVNIHFRLDLYHENCAADTPPHLLI